MCASFASTNKSHQQSPPKYLQPLPPSIKSILLQEASKAQLWFNYYYRPSAQLHPGGSPPHLNNHLDSLVVFATFQLSVGLRHDSNTLLRTQVASVRLLCRRRHGPCCEQKGLKECMGSRQQFTVRRRGHLIQGN